MQYAYPQKNTYTQSICHDSSRESLIIRPICPEERKTRSSWLHNGSHTVVNVCVWLESGKCTFIAHCEKTLASQTVWWPPFPFCLHPSLFFWSVILAGFKSRSLQKGVARLVATSEQMLSRTCRFHAECTAPQGLWPAFSLKTTKPNSSFFSSFPYLLTVQGTKVEKCNLLHWIMDFRSNKHCARLGEERRVRCCHYYLHPWKAKWPFFIDIFIFSIHMVFSLHPRYTGSSSVHSHCDRFYLPDINPDGIMRYAVAKTNLANLSVWYVLLPFKNAYSRISHGFWDLPVLGVGGKYWKLCRLPLSIAHSVWKI